MRDAVHYIGGREQVAVRLRRSARARKMSLRVSHLHGEVTLTLPRQVAAADGLRFAQSKLDWIRKHLARAAPVQEIGEGAMLPVRGQSLRIVTTEGRKAPRIEGDEIHVCADNPGKRLEAWLRAQARADVAEYAGHYAAKLGKPFERLVISDTKSRWGSCSSKGRIMISFRLIMAPPEVLDYVVAHEVAHLAEMNHSARFWAVCERLYGDCSAPRAWLKTHGSGLHSYRFEAE